MKFPKRNDMQSNYRDSNIAYKHLRNANKEINIKQTNAIFETKVKKKGETRENIKMKIDSCIQLMQVKRKTFVNM